MLPSIFSENMFDDFFNDPFDREFLGAHNPLYGKHAKNMMKTDIHEKDVNYLRRCLHTADMAAEYYGWTRVPFLKDGAERDVDEKNDEIYRLILSYIRKK